MMKEFAAEIIFVVVIVFLLIIGSGSSFFQSQVLNPDYLFSEGSSTARHIFDNVVNDRVYSLYKTFLYFLTIFFITMISYCAVRMFEIRKKEHDHLHHEIHEYAHHHAKNEHVVSMSKNANWNKVLTYLSSESSSDWKLAIIEADTMLDQLVTELGFKGQSLGDRLKMASQDTFKGLSNAWEVHTIRNRIAHEGLAYELSKHEANRIIAIYESIFRNYGFV